ncbi:pro-sigmaK processing inhibitor BofA family protein [Paenibacillus solisilvae]|uniref:Pro-sigmaK processing inhibitor BofA family protein n=1 Tax=Paenibacillus solisilvae TaxID=2486751 RepID=A0ABW0W219_9BACL
MIWLIILIASSLLLVGIILRNKLSWSWIKRFSLHLVVAAMALYLLNYSGIVHGFEVPLNPTTIGTVVLLGLPGIILMLGLQHVLF